MRHAKLPIIYFQSVSRGADAELKAERFLAHIPEAPNGTPRYFEREQGESETAVRHRVEIALGDSA